jgi:hypothetical protein
MEKKRQQIEAEQKRRQGLFAVPQVRLEMIALGREHMVGFVVDFPPPAARLGDVGNVGIGAGMMGNEAVVIELGAGFGMARGDCPPMHRPGPFAATQAHLVARAIPQGVGDATAPPTACNLVDGARCLSKGHALIECGRRGGRADKDEKAITAERPGETITGVMAL